jgi:serine/threonine protein kinase
MGAPGEPMADQHHHGSDPLVGRMFHDYVIEEQIGQGGMGAVYVCRHRELQNVRKVLKVIATELIEAPDPSSSPLDRANAERARAFLFERFEREAVAVSRLNHRYIVPIDGIGTVDGRRCILMPFLEGRSLEQVLEERGGCLTPHETLHVVVQIARALDYAHRRGIVHRDLKPANIFVTPSEDDPWEIRVIDFGIAKQMHAGASTAWRGPLGTLLFMAVEQFERASEATPASDVYSLGVMVYAMVTGRYPWGKDHSAFELYRRQLSERPDPAPTMPPGWEETVLSALSPDPQERPRSMQEFVYPLAVALAASPPYKSGLEILRGAAPRWASVSPNDETLRGSATTGAWRAAISGAWIAASGTLPAATSGAWPAGSWPGAASGSWPATAAPVPASAASVAPVPASATAPSATSTLPTAARETSAPPAWKLALLATAAAVLAALVVYVLVRALEGR